jgi:hypothetical protein
MSVKVFYTILHRLSSIKYFSWGLCVFYFLFIFLFYYSGHTAILMDDATLAIYELKNAGIKGFMNSYNTDAFYYGHYAVIALFYFLFGMKPLGWFFMFSILHAANSTLLYCFIKKVLSVSFEEEKSNMISFFTSILFLVSCYQSENILWAATSHYAICLCIFLMLSIALCNFFKQDEIPIAWTFGVFSFSLLTLEISFLFPTFFLFLFLFFKIQQKPIISFSVFFKRILFPQCLIMIVYCVFHFLKWNRFLPASHSGESNMDLKPQLVYLMQSTIKLFAFASYVKSSIREKTYLFCASNWGLLLFTLLFIITIGYIFSTRKPSRYPILLFLVGYLLLFLPFTRGYFVTIFRLENDRYCYFPSLFFFPILCLILNEFFQKIVLCFVLCFCSLSIYFSYQNMMARQASGKLNSMYLSNFNIATDSVTYLLNIPVSCKDAYMYRGKDRLMQALFCKYGKHIDTSSLVGIAWYNAQSDTDSFKVKKTSDSSWQIQLTADGSWWWFESSGATDYETDTYNFKVKEWGAYEIRFKRKLKQNERILLFQRNAFLNVN